MVSFIERLLGRFGGGAKQSAGNSGKLAKDRLQLVLVQDRIDIPAEKMQAMQKEIIDVISKYVMVDIDNVDFELSNRERDGLLVAEIPFKPVKGKENHSLPQTSNAEAGSDSDTDALVADAELESADNVTEMSAALIEDDVNKVTAESNEAETVVVDENNAEPTTESADETDSRPAPTVDADDEVDSETDADTGKRP